MVEREDVIVPTSPEDIRRIRSYLDEISGSMTRIASERDLIKEIIENAHAAFNIPKKTFRKMAKIHHNNAFDAEVVEHEDFVSLYETVTGRTAERD